MRERLFAALAALLLALTATGASAQDATGEGVTQEPPLVEPIPDGSATDNLAAEQAADDVAAVTPTPPPAEASGPASGTSTAPAPYLNPNQPQSEFSYRVETGSLERFEVGKLVISVTQNSVAPNYGFASVRVLMANGHPRKLPVSLSFSSSESNRTVTRQLELGPGEHRTVLLPVPQCSGGMLRVNTPEGGDNHRVYFDRSNVRALLVVGTAESIRQSFGAETTDSAPRVTAYPLPPEALPSELSALAGYDGIVLTGTRLEDLPQAQARALEAYAATGGYLSLLSMGPGTAARLPALKRYGEGGHIYGFGEVRLCAKSRGACAKAVGTELMAHEPSVRPADGPGRAYVRQDGSYGASRAREFLLPQAVPPVGRFLVIIAAFGLLIGPGSLVIARRRGPSMLLFSIPATALLTCLLIVSYSLVMDGFGTHASTMGFTLLDRQNARGVTVGLGGFYANLAPRPTRFGSSSAVMLPWSDEKRGASVDWTEGATFGGDLIPSRSYRELGLLAVEPSRARVVFKKDGNGARLQNGLGSPVRWAVVRTNGEYLEVRDMPDGGEGVATKVAGPPSWEPELNEPLSRFRPLVLAKFRMELKDGEFMALMDGPGPLPLGGLSAEHHESQHLVRGEVE